MSFKTLTYSPLVQGWPSFYSYNPDWMIGMNNYFYSFKGGNLYRHSVNSLRNTFYEQWCDDHIPIPLPRPDPFFPTTLKSVINELSLENKLFKTMDLVGDAPWSATMTTDLQYSGFIDQNWFDRKEATWFAFVRNNTIGELALRSVNGIGNSILVQGGGTSSCFINFSINPLISIGNIISIGDYVYFDTIPNFGGQVLSVNVNLAQGINQIEIDNAMINPLSIPITTNVEYFFYVKNSIAESHGVLGHYCLFELSNNYNTKVELFATESELMKSFP
jgi:fumarate reductase subunit C